MKLNLDAVVRNLAAVSLECEALTMVSILAEVESRHLSVEGFQYKKRTCAVKRTAA